MNNIDVIDQLMRLRNGIITTGLYLGDVAPELTMLVEDMTDRVNLIHKWFIQNPEALDVEMR